MKARSKPTEKRERSVFSTIFISVLVILAVEVTLLIGSIAVSRVPQQLDRNAEDILAKQVENRSRYLEDFLVQAQNLRRYAESDQREDRSAADLPVKSQRIRWDRAALRASRCLKRLRMIW